MISPHDARYQLLATAITTLPALRGESEREVIRICRSIRRSLEAPTEDTSGLSDTAQKLLNALGDQPVHHKPWAARAHLAPGSGSFKTAAKELKDRGLVKSAGRGFYQRTKRTEEEAQIIPMAQPV